MDAVIAQITEMVGKVKEISGGMVGIFSALVALALLAIIFNRIGK